MTRCTKEELVGGTPQENAEITKEILAGKKYRQETLLS